MALPLDYVISGSCIPFSQYLDAGTSSLRGELYTAAEGYANIVIDACDLTGAIDNMLSEGAAELRKNIAAISKMVGEAINAVTSFFDSMVPDNLYNELESLINEVMTTIKSVMDSTSALFDDIKGVIKNVVDGLKNTLCGAAAGFINSVPSVAVQGAIVASTIKGLNVPITPNVDQLMISNAIAYSSGIDTIMESAKAYEQVIYNEIFRINSMASTICGGAGVKPIDNFGIIAGVAAYV